MERGLKDRRKDRRVCSNRYPQRYPDKELEGITI